MDGKTKWKTEWKRKMDKNTPKSYSLTLNSETTLFAFEQD